MLVVLVLLALLALALAVEAEAGVEVVRGDCGCCDGALGDGGGGAEACVRALFNAANATRSSLSYLGLRRASPSTSYACREALRHQPTRHTSPTQPTLWVTPRARVL